jgi:hypothetical protein
VTESGHLLPQRLEFVRTPIRCEFGGQQSVFTLNKRNLPAMRAHPSISDKQSYHLLSAIVEHARSGLLSFTVSETEDVPPCHDPRGCRHPPLRGLRRQHGGNEVGSGRERDGEVTIIVTWKDKKAAPCGVAFFFVVVSNYLMDRVELLYMLSETSTIKPPAG